MNIFLEKAVKLFIFIKIPVNGLMYCDLGVAKDISGEKLRLCELNKELRETKQLAEQANQSKSDFLAMMSHEL